MFLKQDKKPDGRVYLSIVRGFRDPVTKKNKSKTVQSLGYLDELQQTFDDPVAHFKQVARQMTQGEDQQTQVHLSFSLTDTLPVGTHDIKNLGFLALSRIYHALGIHTFLIHRERGLRANIPLNSIMKLLVFERILEPGSKRAAFQQRDKYLESFSFTEEGMYRSLRLFPRYKTALLTTLHEAVRQMGPRDTRHVFYDVTNYYFHTDQDSELIRQGYAKDRKGKPIVQMGLLLDNEGIPMTYQLFPGNTSDFETLLPILSEVKRDFGLSRVIVVADKGLNSGTNKAYALIRGDGYIFSRSIRGTKASKEIKNFVLDEKGYVWHGEEFRLKSRIIPTEITVENEQGKSVKVSIDEKHVAFYSPKYAKRSHHLRQQLIDKANQLMDSPSRYAKAEQYGALKYIQGMQLNKETGEIKPVDKSVKPVLNAALIQEEERYDGYYSIVTSELDMPDLEIIERYRGLWKIEESFRVTKSELETRPVYVRREDCIEAHFLTCFIALLLLRLLQRETGYQFSTAMLVESLRKANVCFLDQNYYRAIYYDDVLEAVDQAYALNLNQKIWTLDGIKKMIARTKKVE